MEHSFWNLTGCTEGGDCYDCHVFNSCHGNWQASECHLPHWACGTTAMLYKAARDLARSGMTSERLVGNQEAAQLHVNAKREMIQVLNCDGAVVAQFRMSRNALARLARSPEGTASVRTL
jgi:hypothetical protein